MRQASLDLQGASITDKRLPVGETIFYDGEEIIWQVGDVCDGLVFDLSVLMKRPAEVRRNVHLAFVVFFDFRNMHGAFVWAAHGGFAAAGKTMSWKIRIVSGYKFNVITGIV